MSEKHSVARSGPVTVRLNNVSPLERIFVSGVELFCEDVAVVVGGKLESVARGAYYQRAVESVCRWLSPTFTRGDLVGLRVL
jgi:hypothetical protein